MHFLSWLFLAFLLAGTVLRLWLASRQMRAVAAHRDHVPAPFADVVSAEQHRKAAEYTITRSRAGIVETVIDAALLALWTLGGGLYLIDQAWRNVDLGPLWTGTGMILSTFMIMTLLALPFSAYRTFVIEERFGFNKTTPALFVTDLLKGAVLMIVLGAPLSFAILWLMRGAGDLWWLYAWLVWTGFSLALTWAWPAFIAPLFNKFSPLQNEPLRARIEALLERCGFRSKGIFVMDGSRRSAHGNAYFTGVGNSKRIVFFDTLMASLEHGEVEAVLAHELGHFRMRHVRKRLLLGFAFSLLGFALLGWLEMQAWFYTALGIDTPSPHAALILFLLVVPVFLFPLTPLGAWLSRRHEFEADAYAAGQSDARALIAALVKLYRDNASTLTPDPVHSAFYDSHPPAGTRIARLKELRAKVPDTGTPLRRQAPGTGAP
ncbi:MAG: M48 family metallopeptidase [Gammaproteobacteria bacterium]|nr:M48 family metallopeptidase [Gammaproteobacteria bacterium]